MRACLALLTVIGLGVSFSYAQEGGSSGTAYTCVTRLRPYVPPGFEIMAVNPNAMMINHHKSGRTFYFQRDSAVEIQGANTAHIDIGTLKQVLRPPTGETKVQMQLAIEECGRTFNWMTDPTAKALLEKAKEEDEAAAKRAQKLAELKKSRQKLGNPKIAIRGKSHGREPAAKKGSKKIVESKKSKKDKKEKKEKLSKKEKSTKKEKLAKSEKSGGKKDKKQKKDLAKHESPKSSKKEGKKISKKESKAESKKIKAVADKKATSKNRALASKYFEKPANSKKTNKKERSVASAKNEKKHKKTSKSADKEKVKKSKKKKTTEDE